MISNTVTIKSWFLFFYHTNGVWEKKQLQMNETKKDRKVFAIFVKNEINSCNHIVIAGVSHKCRISLDAISFVLFVEMAQIKHARTHKNYEEKKC